MFEAPLLPAYLCQAKENRPETSHSSPTEIQNTLSILTKNGNLGDKDTEETNPEKFHFTQGVFQDSFF